MFPALCKKAWLETRTRFVLSGLALTLLCGGCVAATSVLRVQDGRTLTYAQYVYRFAYGGWLRGAFVLLAMTFGIGGPLRERTEGTAAFTLALPTARWLLVWTRALIGALELAALAMIPLLIPALSPWAAGETYPWTQAVEFAGLWIVCGVAILALSTLVSSVVAFDANAFVVVWLIWFVYTSGVNLTVLRRYPALNLNRVMSGSRMDFLDAGAGRLLHVPYGIAIVVLVAAAALLVASWAAFARQDF